MGTRSDSSRRLLISAWMVAAFTSAAWAQSIVVRQLEKGTSSEQTQKLEVRVSADEDSGPSCAANGTEGATAGREKVKGKRIELIVEACVDSTAWEARLTDVDIDARELAFDELIARARKDTSLGLALKTWATDSSNPELAWNARMALRELRKQRRPMAVTWVPRAAPNQSGMQEAHAILNEAQKDTSHKEPVPPGLRDLNPGSVLPLANRQMMSLSAPRAFEMPRGNDQHQLRLKLEYQPEGITLVVAEIHHGQMRQRKYASGSIESLLVEHPELLEQIPALGNFSSERMARVSNGLGRSGFRSIHMGNPMQGPGMGGLSMGEIREHATRGIHSGEMGLRGQWVHQNGELMRAAVPLVGQGVQSSGGPDIDSKSSGPSARILGVKVTALSISDAESQLLGPGVGLLIERREPGSIAEALELERGDILVELFGQQLCSAEEITRLLQSNTGDEVTVKFVDRDGIERVRTWKPAKR